VGGRSPGSLDSRRDLGGPTAHAGAGPGAHRVRLGWPLARPMDRSREGHGKPSMIGTSMRDGRASHAWPSERGRPWLGGSSGHSGPASPRFTGRMAEITRGVRCVSEPLARARTAGGMAPAGGWHPTGPTDRLSWRPPAPGGSLVSRSRDDRSGSPRQAGGMHPSRCWRPSNQRATRAVTPGRMELGATATTGDVLPRRKQGWPASRGRRRLRPKGVSTMSWPASRGRASQGRASRRADEVGSHPRQGRRGPTRCARR
jgi:hypothetical protein